jgi:proline racemase
MNFKQMIHVIDAHTAGDPLRLVTGCIPAVKGATMKAKVEQLIRTQPQLLKTTMWEPRGHKDMFGAVLLDPVAVEADFGLVFFDTGTYYYGMCGHGTIAAATIVVETGMVEYHEPVTNVVFETYDGLVRAAVKVKNREAIEVTITNVPSFLYREGINVTIDGFDPITADLSYGGGFYILVQADHLGLQIEKLTATRLQAIAMMIKETVASQWKPVHPSLPEATDEMDVFFYAPVSGEPRTYRVLDILTNSNQLTRSPCGTGTSALLAMLHGKNLITLQEEIVTRSFLGTEFRGCLSSEFTDGQYTMVIPEVTGSAYITGFNQLVVCDRDPLGGGFLV